MRDYVHRIRPPQRPFYLKLHFARGECAQANWGVYGSIAVGNTRRRFSFFVMVLAFGRQMYVEFTVSQRANEKGRVESGVGYVKKNFLNGLELTEFTAIHAAAQVWLDTIANAFTARRSSDRSIS